MLSDLIFIVVLLISFVLFIMAFSWKKQHFIKGLYIDQSVGFVYIYTFIVILEIVPYLVFLRDQNAVFIYAILSASMDFALLLMCVSSITTCVYLEDTNLIYKNLFVIKKIDLKGNDVILKEKMDKRIVVSKHFRITISHKHLSGDINYLFYQIKAILNHNK